MRTDLPACTRPDWLQLPDVDVAALVAEHRERFAALRPGRPLPDAHPVAPAGAGPMVLEEAPPAEAPPQVDVDMGWLTALHAEHVELLEAWQARAGAVHAARERFDQEDARYRVELRRVARAGGDPSTVAEPSSAPVRRAQIDVLGEEERRTRRALAEFAVRVIRRELRAHWEMLSVVARVADRPSPKAEVQELARAAGHLFRLSGGEFVDADNALAAIASWSGDGR